MLTVDENRNGSTERISTYCVMRLERRTAWNSEARAQHTQYASPASNYTTRTVPQSRPTDHRIDRTVDQNTGNQLIKTCSKTIFVLCVQGSLCFGPRYIQFDGLSLGR